MSTVRKNTGQEQEEYDEVYSIKDTPKILVLILVTVVGFGGAAFALVSPFMGAQVGGALIGAGVALLVGIVGFLLAKANLGGIVLDLKNDTLEFPGGGVSANEITDYLNPAFLMQAFKRHQVPLSEIREIDRYDKYTRKRDKDGRVTETVTPYITFNGSFGAVGIRFGSEGKRDELYSILREVNEMGLPVVNQ